jgi:hypothetical protein
MTTRTDLRSGISWAFAPLQIADVLAVGFLGASVLLVVVRVAWGFKKNKHPV